MRVLEKDLRRGMIKLYIEDSEDLWILFNIVRDGDVVYARTTREVKPGEGGSSRRIPMLLGVSVKALEFQEFSESLRIRGIVIDGPEEYGVKGHYHTLNVGIGDVVEIRKEKWGKNELELIERGARKRRRVLLAAIDQDDACIVLLTEQGIRVLSEMRSDIPGKAYKDLREASVKDFVKEFLEIISSSAASTGVDVVIIASPSWLADDIGKLARESLKGLHVYTDSVSSGGCVGINELLRRDVVKNVVSDLSVVEGARILDEFRELLSKEPELVVYGLDQVKSAADYGAIAKLAIVDTLLRAGELETRDKVYEILNRAYETNAFIVIVPGRSDVGYEISALGGAIAILRYRLSIT